MICPDAVKLIKIRAETQRHDGKFCLALTEAIRIYKSYIVIQSISRDHVKRGEGIHIIKTASAH